MNGMYKNDFEIIEDEPEYPEKPKRKEKPKGIPINWRKYGEHLLVGMSVILGGFAFLLMVGFITWFVNSLCSQITLSVQPREGMNTIQRLMDTLMPFVSIGAGVSITLSILAFIGQKLK